MTYCERNQAINMPYFRNLRFGNSGFEFKDGHKALTIKVFSTILSLTEVQNPAYLFTKRKFRKQSFPKPALFFHRLMQEEFFQHTIPIYHLSIFLILFFRQVPGHAGADSCAE